MGSITSTSIAAKYADGVATDALFSTLYAELHRLAKRELWRAGPASLSVTCCMKRIWIFRCGTTPRFPIKPASWDMPLG